MIKNLIPITNYSLIKINRKKIQFLVYKISLSNYQACKYLLLVHQNSEINAKFLINIAVNEDLKFASKLFTITIMQIYYFSI